jgi:hypothetical protein
LRESVTLANEAASCAVEVIAFSVWEVVERTILKLSTRCHNQMLGLCGAFLSSESWPVPGYLKYSAYMYSRRLERNFARSIKCSRCVNYYFLTQPLYVLACQLRQPLRLANSLRPACLMLLLFVLFIQRTLVPEPYNPVLRPEDWCRVGDNSSQT